ncbi:MAG: PEP-CTERM sorting domain-containing protein [Acidobacteria bacterium]|nr:PEP-CTERM sorting domain-containing protein [Acidobacteriota bacterium]
MMNFKHFLGLGVAILASLPAFSVPTARLRVTDVTSNTVLLDITDNGLGDTDNTIDGLISLGTTTTIDGNWRLRFTGATTKPDSGSASIPELALQSNIELLAATPRTLRIEFTDLDFTGNPFQGVLGTTTNASLGATGNVGYGARIDGGNAAFGGSFMSNLGLDNTAVSSPNTYNKKRQGGVENLSLYSLTIVSEVTFNTLGRLDVDATLSAVPEPGFYGALALGLSGLFALARRRNAVKE